MSYGPEYFTQTSNRLKSAVIRAKEKVLDRMAKDSDYFVPEDTGITRAEMIIDKKNFVVKWVQDWIERIYWGIDLNFHKDKNPNAQAMWCDEAIDRFADEWAEIYADEIERAL